MSSNDPRVIVALDYPEARGALELAGRLDPISCRLKVGKELYTAAGPALVEKLAQSGFGIFLDLKYHDIPNTVASACAAAAGLGVWMINVHALGGRAMMSAAREALAKTARPPKLIAVTILTSMGAPDLADIGLAGSPQEAVTRLARLAQACGLDGVVCSPQEAAILRRECGKAFTLVTPGIRPAEADKDDQQRIATPRRAIADGADYLVIGRPITRAPDPLAALRAINAEIAG
jgi:orotidine-5'-phosphate decarboxylase